MAIIFQHSTARLRRQSETQFFSVAVIKDPDQRRLEGKGFNLVPEGSCWSQGLRDVGVRGYGGWVAW